VDLVLPLNNETTNLAATSHEQMTEVTRESRGDELARTKEVFTRCPMHAHLKAVETTRVMPNGSS
jgi:hypothetical protein